MITDEPVRGVFAYLQHPGLLSMTGLEQMRAFVRREIPYGPPHFMTGYDIVEADEGRSVWRLPVTPWLQSSAGVLTGGALAYAGDAAMGGALYTTLPPNTLLATSELSMNFLHPPTLESEAIVATGGVIKAGRSQGLTETSVEDARGRLLAHATSRCLVRQLPGHAPEPPALPIPWPEYEGPHPYQRPAEGAVVPQETWDRMSGPEMYAAWLAGDLPPSPLDVLTGQRLVEVGEGSAVLSMPASPWFCTAGGTFYGGALALLVDHALHAAVHTTMPAGASWGTLDLKVNFLRPVTPDGRDLRARARVAHRGRTIAVTTGEVLDAADRRILLATASMMLMPGRPWRPDRPAEPMDEPPDERSGEEVR